ncbi:lysoplasmalogenase [Xenorhabdus sp. 12]|uniref:Lysoplasmalogenase n=1 Tax=Xenorhabdus santafensis TaxID=2582833 RepID=A0ABU4SBE5_9GAMM|nr:lysoplasmalogenase [Xenorhabdus sp. 12]MDX7988061.1 lysoplasmalogenase [Xenorhabdus sp. 12]
MAPNNCTLQHKLHNKIGLFYILFSVCAIAGISLSNFVNPAWIWLHYLTKPTATALLVPWVLLSRTPVSIRYRNAIAFGLALAVVGDICLMLPQDYFLAGLFCFLLTHCAYIYALCCDNISLSAIRNKKLSSEFILLRAIFIITAVFVIFEGIAALILIRLWEYLPNSMKIPVSVYAAILAFMAGLAVNRAIVYPFKNPIPATPYDVTQHIAKNTTSNSAAFGGIFFVISDSLLAYGRFYVETPLSPLLVLGTYYIAQWCFASSVQRRDQ